MTRLHGTPPLEGTCFPHIQGVENKKAFELNEEEINKIREEVGKYITESDLVSLE